MDFITPLMKHFVLVAAVIFDSLRFKIPVIVHIFSFIHFEMLSNCAIWKNGFSHSIFLSDFKLRFEKKQNSYTADITLRDCKFNGQIPMAIYEMKSNACIHIEMDCSFV